jgi:preprotein translocase subunit Sss1
MPDELAAAFKTMKHVSSLAAGEIRWNENSYRRILVDANKPVRAEYYSRG